MLHAGIPVLRRIEFRVAMPALMVTDARDVTSEEKAAGVNGMLGGRRGLPAR